MDGSFGRVRVGATLVGAIKAGWIARRSKSVVVFASKGFAFSHAMVILVAALLSNTNYYLRIFGGRPYDLLNRYPVVLRRLVEFLLRRATVISLETEAGRADFPKNVRERVTTLTGYRTPAPSPVAVERGRKESFRFAFAGRVDASKGIDTLINAFGAIDRDDIGIDIELHLFGSVDEDIRHTLTGRENVYLHGLVENTTYRSQLGSFDCFVFPSRYANEGHPGAIIEAFMAGIPVISSDLSTIVEIVHHDKNGIVVPVGDEESLGSAMVRMASDPDLASRLATGAAKSGDRFRDDTVIPQLIALFNL